MYMYCNTLTRTIVSYEGVRISLSKCLTNLPHQTYSTLHVLVLYTYTYVHTCMTGSAN